jgi:hypothetical protein
MYKVEGRAKAVNVDHIDGPETSWGDYPKANKASSAENLLALSFVLLTSFS